MIHYKDGLIYELVVSKSPDKGNDVLWRTVESTNVESYGHRTVRWADILLLSELRHIRIIMNSINAVCK